MNIDTLALIKHIGLTFSLGASTIALVFYFQSLADKVVDKSERHFMHTVYFLLRIGVWVLVVWELSILLFASLLGGAFHPYLVNPQNWFRVLLLGVLIIDTGLILRRSVPPWFAAALSSATWYYYYYLSLSHEYHSVAGMFFSYVLFAFVFVTLFKLLRNFYMRRKTAQTY